MSTITTSSTAAAIDYADTRVVYLFTAQESYQYQLDDIPGILAALGEAGYPTEVATLDQMKEAHALGAQWCHWCFVRRSADVAPNAADMRAYLRAWLAVLDRERPSVAASASVSSGER